jgi:hypothetical protein
MMYRCSKCKSTNCIKIFNNEPKIPFKCNCYNCESITDLEYFNETKIRPNIESNPFNNLPNNFKNE